MATEAKPNGAQPTERGGFATSLLEVVWPVAGSHELDEFGSWVSPGGPARTARVFRKFLVPVLCILLVVLSLLSGFTFMALYFAWNAVIFIVALISSQYLARKQARATEQGAGEDTPVTSAVFRTAVVVLSQFGASAAVSMLISFAIAGVAGRGVFAIISLFFVVQFIVAAFETIFMHLMKFKLSYGVLFCAVQALFLWLNVSMLNLGDPSAGSLLRDTWPSALGAGIVILVSIVKRGSYMSRDPGAAKARVTDAAEEA